MLCINFIYLWEIAIKLANSYCLTNIVNMKIKWGALVVDGRGKIGGQIASKNGAGAYMKNKVTPSNPQTPAQTAARALFGSISAGWSALTASQIAAWNGAVSDWTSTNIFGDLKKPSGKALYQRLNNQALSVGLAAISNPPAKLDLPNNPITAIPIAVGAATLDATGASTDAAVRVVVWGTPPVSAGTKNVKSQLRQLYSVAGDSYDAAAAFTAYEEKFGALATGQNVFIGVKYVLASGQASPLQVLKATISA